MRRRVGTAGLERCRDLLESTRAIAAMLDEGAVRAAIPEQAARLLHGEAAVLLLRDEARALRPEATYHLSTEQAARAQVPVGGDVSAALRDLGRDEGLGASVGVPLVLRGETLGMLAVYRRGERRPGPDDQELLSALADQAAIALHNARQHAQLQRRLAELEEQERERGIFVSAIAHELSNRITPVEGYAQLLVRRVEFLAEIDRKAAETIAREARRLGRLVSDLVDASRIQAGRFRVERGTTDLVEVARSAIEAEQVTTTKHQLVLDAPARLEGVWDHDRIAQVLSNLASNAIKYSPEGGEVRVAIRRKDREAEVCVADQGVGLAPEAIPQVFEPFSRLYQERRTKGLGLGLYVARGIVEAHGGRLWASSPGPGQGSTFCFTLPRP